MLPGEEHPCAPAALEVLGPREARLTLTEGRYHQVRRMFAVLDATVVALHRESFGALSLEGLAPGQWRELPPGTFAAG
jgi:16S rRNA pseudouridine516 synthase